MPHVNILPGNAVQVRELKDYLASHIYLGCRKCGTPAMQGEAQIYIAAMINGIPPSPPKFSSTQGTITLIKRYIHRYVPQDLDLYPLVAGLGGHILTW